MELDGESGTYFAVWAPNAMRISVVGDFNGWDGRIHQMRRLGDSGIFELFIPGAEAGDCYKYELKIKGGLTYLKADPYGNAAQKRPETASVIADLRDFSWDDSEFLKKGKLLLIRCVFSLFGNKILRIRPISVHIGESLILRL